MLKTNGWLQGRLRSLSTANFGRLSGKKLSYHSDSIALKQLSPVYKKEANSFYTWCSDKSKPFHLKKMISYSSWQLLKLVNILRRTVHKNSRIHNILNNKFKSIIISIWPNYSWITTLVYLIIKNFKMSKLLNHEIRQIWFWNL